MADAKAMDGHSIAPRSSRDAREAPGAVANPSPRAFDRSAVLGDFAHALSIAVVCQRSLAAQELAQVGDEEEALREAIRQLRNVLRRAGWSYEGLMRQRESRPGDNPLRHVKTWQKSRLLCAPP